MSRCAACGAEVDVPVGSPCPNCGRTQLILHFGESAKAQPPSEVRSLGYIEEPELTRFLSRQYGVPSINLAEFEIPTNVIAIIPRDMAERHQLIPVNRAGASLIIAMADPSNIFAIDNVRSLSGLNVEVVVTSGEGVRCAIEKYYGAPE